MKQFIVLLLAVGLVACTPKHDGYTIHATFTGIDSAMVVLKTQIQSDIPADTVYMANGTFTFRNKLVTPEAYVVTISGFSMFRFPLYVENCPFTITGDIDDLKNIVVTGGPYQAAMDSLAKVKEAIEINYPAREELTQEYLNPATTDSRKQEIEAMMRELAISINEVDDNYVAQNPTSRVALARFVSTLGYYDVPILELEERVAAFTAAFPEGAENRFIKRADTVITTLQTVQVGMIAPDFTMNDPKGTPIAFSDFYTQNRVTMVDFWAGWCGPCRQFNPELVKIYNKHHKDGFGIFGVSFDHTESQWIQAIADDKLTWTQVSELKWWNNSAAKLYFVRSIPQNIFVDGNGVIVARRLEGDDIDAFLTEFLTK